MLFWRANYLDGTYLLEKDGNIVHIFADVDQPKLRSFQLVKATQLTKNLYQIDFDSPRHFSVDLLSGKFNLTGLIIEPSFFDGTPYPDCQRRLIFFKRHTICDGAECPLIFLLGWQTTIDNKNYKNVVFIKPDGELFIEFSHLKVKQ